jgi:hypothetical protein
MSESVDLAILYGRPINENGTFFSNLLKPFLHPGHASVEESGKRDQRKPGSLKWLDEKH